MKPHKRQRACFGGEGLVLEKFVRCFGQKAKGLFRRFCGGFRFLCDRHNAEFGYMWQLFVFR